MPDWKVSEDPILEDHVDVECKVASGGYKWTPQAPEVIPAFVAEHDLGPLPAMRERLREVVDLGGFGYHLGAEELAGAFSSWWSRRHGWDADPALVVPNASVLQGVWACVEAFTLPGDAVVLPTPVYFPFHDIAPTTGRRIADWPLVRDTDGWHHDLDALERLLSDDPGIRLLLLCHPHNPTGKVLTVSELTRIVELAAEHDVVVASDEIHADFTYPGADGGTRHVPTATIPDAAPLTVTLTSGIKTFAMGGLKASVAAFADERLHAQFLKVPANLLGGQNRLGNAAAIAGWTNGDAWVDQLVTLFDRHRRHLVDRLAAEAPHVRVHLPESTFLAWLDLSAYEPGDRPDRWLRDRTSVLGKDGNLFGSGGAGHVRLTFGTSTVMLDEILDRLVTGLPGVPGP
jgi:cystathionine beta-lyase